MRLAIIRSCSLAIVLEPVEVNRIGSSTRTRQVTPPPIILKLKLSVDLKYSK